MTPAELARYLRVSPDFIRDEIRAGRMKAINTSRVRCGRPRYVVLPHHLAEWERSREATPMAQPAPRRKKRTDAIDFYPD
jgi:excisionase family DNA binding protein